MKLPCAEVVVGSAESAIWGRALSRGDAGIVSWSQRPVATTRKFSGACGAARLRAPVALQAETTAQHRERAERRSPHARARVPGGVIGACVTERRHQLSHESNCAQASRRPSGGRAVGQRSCDRRAAVCGSGLRSATAAVGGRAVAVAAVRRRRRSGHQRRCSAAGLRRRSGDGGGRAAVGRRWPEAVVVGGCCGVGRATGSAQDMVLAQAIGSEQAVRSP